MSERKYGLVVLVLNNFVGCTELFWSVKEQVTPFIVRNWDHNIGVAAGWNEGIKRAFDAGCTHVMVANDDVVFGSRTFSRPAQELDTNPQVLLATGCNVRGQPGITHLNIDKYGSESIVDGPDYSCFMIKREYIDQIGWFDENLSYYGKAYFEDNDSHYRLKLAGKRGVACGIATMLHRGSQTQNHKPGSPVITGQMFEANRNYYVRKWGGKPGEEKFRTPYNAADLSYVDWTLGR